MDELSNQAKKKVLEEIMQLLDEDMTNGLKSKSPKFMSVEVQAKPEAELELKHGSLPTDDEHSSDEHLSAESKSDDEDDLERLKELYSSLK